MPPRFQPFRSYSRRNAPRHSRAAQTENPPVNGVDSPSIDEHLIQRVQDYGIADIFGILGKFDFNNIHP